MYLVSMRRKGYQMPVRAVAAILLGILVVVLVYGGFQGWFGDVTSNFVGNVNYPKP